jgi:hypothetical protein
MSSPPVAVPAGRVITGLVQVACLAAVAVVVAAAPWLSRPWRRAAWLALLLAAAARLLAGTVLPMQLILALAAGSLWAPRCWWRAACPPGGSVPPGWRPRCGTRACR